MCKQLIQLIFYEFYIFDGNNDRFSAVVTLQKFGNKDMESFCAVFIRKKIVIVQMKIQKLYLTIVQ